METSTSVDKYTGAVGLIARRNARVCRRRGGTGTTVVFTREPPGGWHRGW
ncbi:hypothetical protein I542_2388 [Mycobacteroides abscessus 1948]|uniref:Uncharacterized protein n=1 Tax=Mycobacteroides abscessus 1948 TaxID=1299323 RepID=A0A829QHM5_9MYCO|nr:hypothetical protein I542_2388 [Mycobacteroides abscessus 1948]